MTDIDGLKQRINLVDLRLQTAHSARERESVALTEIWEEMRGRYTDQQELVDSLRTEVASLEDQRSELLTLVSSLLDAVEQGVEKIADGTMPDIASNVSELLGTSLEEQIEATKEDIAEPTLEDAAIETVDTDTTPPPIENEGILDLISRLESSVSEDDYFEPDPNEADAENVDATEEDEDLNSLRAELEKLRTQAVAATA